MNIILASAEVEPFAKAGGLADIASSLPIEWLKYGQNPIVIMPRYGFIDVEHWGFKPTGLLLTVPMGYWKEYATLLFGTLPGTNVPVYLVEHNNYFDRPGIYGYPNEYGDNDRRFIFFSRAVFEAAIALNFPPDIIHAHDFHTAFTMAFLKTHYKNHYMFSETAGVYTIHNLAYQGWFNPSTAMEYIGLGSKEFYPGSWFELNGAVNSMKAGIMFADKITTVSPTYANEIRVPYYSEGMQDVLNLRGYDFIGILNGANYNEWDPVIDTMIYKNYTLDTIELKKENKYHLLRELGLTDDDDLDLPLVGVVSRLAEQKGMDLITNKLESYLCEGKFRFILLGTGDKNYEEYFSSISEKYPKLALIRLGYDTMLSHKIFAASDFFLLPSRFEPCGLTQLYAMRYGTIPIVRMTGGLNDTVKEYNPSTGEGTGFMFWAYNADDFSFAMHRGLELYEYEPHWSIIRKNAMEQNFSSSKSALEYLRVFHWAIEKVRT